MCIHASGYTNYFDSGADNCACYETVTGIIERIHMVQEMVNMKALFSIYKTLEASGARMESHPPYSN